VKGDFTRFTFNPAAHRAAVLQQQGRVQLDADWNEWAAIQLHRWRVQTVDTIGECGAPLHDAGFQVAASVGPKNAAALTLTPGRAYVEGLLCELETPDGKPLDYTQQPSYPNPDPLAMGGLGEGKQRTDLVYIEAWLRHVSALEDPALLEPALGGPDTATRLQTVWQVRLLENVGAGVDCGTDVAAYDALTAPSGGRMTTGTVAIPSAADPCLVNPKGGFSGLENQLYRVEIHAAGPLGTASFKWSRDNAAIGSRVAAFIDGTHLQVDSLGRDAYTQFRIGQWVEIIGDAAELDDGRGILAKIADIEPDRILTLSTDVSAIKGQANLRVRRWDMADGLTGPQPDGTIPTAAGPITLENGVTVSFSGANFLVGDYWVFAARVAGGGAAGPSVEPLIQAPPLGIRRHFCRLALVTWTMTKGVLSGQVQQCLPVFPPLTELPAGEGCCTVLRPGPSLGSRLQAALAAIAETGGCVCLPAGDYVLETPLVIRRARRVTLCGCAGAVRLLWNNPDAAAITIAGSQRVIVAGVSLYGSGARALVEVVSSQDVAIRDAWLVNLPETSRPSVCVAVAAGTDGLTLESCNLLGDVALQGGPASFAKEVQGGVLRIAVERCRVLARIQGVFLPAVQGLRIEDSSFAGLPAETWKQLAAAGTNLSASGLPALDGTLAGLFHAPPTTNGLVPAGVMVLSASQVRVARNQIWAGIGFAGVAVELAEFASNLAVTLIGCLFLTGRSVDIHGNTIQALLLGIGGAGVSLGWQVRGNRLSGRDGVGFRSSLFGQALLNRAVAALGDGLSALAVGPDGVAMQGFAGGGATGAGGAALSRLVAPQVSAAVARLAGLGRVGLAQTVAIVNNEITCSDLGIAVNAGVRAADVHIRDNSVTGAQVAGISLLGTAGSAGANPAAGAASSSFRSSAFSPAAGTSGVLVDGNVVAGSGLGIVVETAGTTVAANTIAVVGTGVANPDGAAVAGLFQAVAATQFAAAAAGAGDVRVVRTGFDQLTLRMARGDLSSAEAGAVAAQAEGPLAAALKDAGLGQAADNLRAAAATLRAGDLQTAAAHLSVVGSIVAAALGSAGIRLAADDVAANGNAVFAGGAERGGIWVDAPSGANVVVNADGSGGQALHTVAVRDNLISGGAGHGVEVSVAVSGLSITGNEIRNMAGCGILAFDIKEAIREVEIAQNRVEDCVGAAAGQARERAGIALYGARQLSVAGNSVFRCGAKQAVGCFGIAVDHAADVSLRGNTVSENGGSITGGSRFNGGVMLFLCRGLLLLTENRCVANQDSALVVEGEKGAQVRLTVTSNCFDAPGAGPFESIGVTAGDVIFSLNQITHRGTASRVASLISADNAAVVLGNIWEVDPKVLPLPDPLPAARFTVIGNVTEETTLTVRNANRNQAQVNNVPHSTP